MPSRRTRTRSVYPAELLHSPLFSRQCKEAFRAMERLAAASIRNPRSVRNLDALAAETGTSVPALEQVLHFLRLAGLLDSPERPSGGVRLSRPAARISILEVVRAIDGAGVWGRCILGLAQCSDAAPCPAHSVWKKTRAVLERHLETQSLADLTRAVAHRRRLHRSSELRWR